MTTSSGDIERMAYVSTFLPGEDYGSAEFPRRVADRCVDLGAGVHIFLIHARGRVPFDSRVMPGFPGLEDDLLGRLIEEHHRRDIKFIAGWAAVNDYAVDWLANNPEWVQVNPDGSKGLCLCYNGPARDYILAQVDEVLARYPVDGIYFDQLPMACFCDFCRTSFDARYGRPMPALKSAPWMGHGAPPRIEAGEQIEEQAPMVRDMERFSNENLTAFLSGVKGKIRVRRPAARFIINKIWGARCRLARPYVDGYLPEVLWWTVNGNRHDLALTRLLTRAYHDVPIWDEVKYDVKVHPRSRPVAEARVLMAEAVANRCPTIVRDEGALDRDPEKARQVSATLKDLAGVLRQRLAARPVRYCALIHSAASESTEPPERHLTHLRGLHTFLIEQQIPYTVVSEEAVQAGGLSGHAAAIVVESAYLEPRTVESLTRFVEAGGGLLGVGRIGVNGPDGVSDLSLACEPLFGVRGGPIRTTAGRRPQDSVHWAFPVGSPATGIFHYGRTRTGHPILQGLEDRELHFDGGHVHCEPSGPCQILADVLAPDFSRLCRGPTYGDPCLFAGEPAVPLLVVRDVGKGRTAYLAGCLGDVRARAKCEHWETLLRGTVAWLAAVPIPVRLERGCPGVRVCLDELPDQRGYFLYLVNQASSGFDRGALTWTCPLRGATVEMGWPWKEPPAVETLAGGPFVLEGIRENRARITIEELDVYGACRVIRTSSGVQR